MGAVAARSAVSTRRGGGYYGFKIHAAVDSKTGLPLAWTIQTAKDMEQTHAPALLDKLHSRGFRPETCAMDSGYDTGPVHDAFEARDSHPIVKLRQTGAVRRGDHKPPTCEHGHWRFAGADYKRKATKWRCPTGECTPASRWIKADRLHPLIPRETLRWGKLYADRSAVERAFGRAKNEWALLPLRVRGLERVRLHADLTMLAQLACALARARTVPLAA
jgi:transposase, IS5 family